MFNHSTFSKNRIKDTFIVEKIIPSDRCFQSEFKVKNALQVYFYAKKNADVRRKR